VLLSLNTGFDGLCAHLKSNGPSAGSAGLHSKPMHTLNKAAQTLLVKTLEDCIATSSFYRESSRSDNVYVTLSTILSDAEISLNTTKGINPYLI
jgi:hypothetical protein